MDKLKQKFLSLMIEEYPTIPQLRYRHGFNQNIIDRFYEFKHKLLEPDNGVLFNTPNLLSECKNPLYYFKNVDFLSEMLDIYKFINNDDSLLLPKDFHNDIIKGFIFSEIEGSLSIEGIHSTRKKIKAIENTSYELLKDDNSIIIKNMINGYNYILDNDINENNLFELYKILSKNCLNTQSQLLPNNNYRHSSVEIIDSMQVIIDTGVDSTNIDWMMKDLFKYINTHKHEINALVAPYIIHYYFIYIHPYFDYNGRTARVLSFWYSLKYLPNINYLIMSEAINKGNKKEYYSAIEASRETNNDLTYFIKYLATSSTNYTKVYFNLTIIIDSLLIGGTTVSNSEKTAIKNVLSLSLKQKGYFDWKKYMKYDDNNYKKQYYLRLLNSLVSYGLLDFKLSKGVKLFILNYSNFKLINM